MRPTGNATCSGNIITFSKRDTRARVRSPRTGRARIRIRRAGFELLGETFNYLRAGNTYHVGSSSGTTSSSSGRTGGTAGVRSRSRGIGLIGLRTFRTVLWWDNIRVTAIK